MKRLAAFAALLFAGCHCAPCISDSVHIPGPCCDNVGSVMEPHTTYKQMGYTKSMGGTVVGHPAQHGKAHVGYGHAPCGHPGCGPVCFRPLACLANLFHCGPGCGEIYWGEWISDPPDACDPCDDHGNWIGPQPCNHLCGYYAKGMHHALGAHMSHTRFHGCGCGSAVHHHGKGMPVEAIYDHEQAVPQSTPSVDPVPAAPDTASHRMPQRQQPQAGVSIRSARFQRKRVER